MSNLDKVGEISAIRQLCRLLPPSRLVIQGPGDDCAVVRPRGASEDWLLTSDPVIEGVHFAPGTRPELIGRKGIARVLSDIAAMGGRPDWALIDVVAPGSASMARIQRIYRGAASIAARHGLIIVGGDTSSGRSLELHVFAVGSVPRGHALLRSGAKPGHGIFVTGSLGGSSGGKHLRFQPRLREGQWLRGWASAMIDLSDGLATDLRHLLMMSRAGADVQLHHIPVAAAAQRIRGPCTPLRRALTDGEDFELLFTVPPSRIAAFMRAWKRTFSLPCTRIGVVTSAVGHVRGVDARGNTSALPSSGYEHFRRRTAAIA